MDGHNHQVFNHLFSIYRATRTSSNLSSTSRSQTDFTSSLRRYLVVSCWNIFRLEVSMSNTLGVEKFKGRGHIRDYISRFLLGEIFPLLNMVQQLATRYLLKDEVKSV